MHYTPLRYYKYRQCCKIFLKYLIETNKTLEDGQICKSYVMSLVNHLLHFTILTPLTYPCMVIQTGFIVQATIHLTYLILYKFPNLHTFFACF